MRRRLEADPSNKTLRLELGKSLVSQGDESGLAELEPLGDVPAFADAALQFGKFRKAAAYRTAAESTKNEAQASRWRTQSWTALKWATLESRLPDVITGTLVPDTAASWSDFAHIAQRTRKHVSATKLFASATDVLGVRRSRPWPASAGRPTAAP